MADFGPGLGDAKKALKALRAPGPIYSRVLRAGGILLVGAIANPTKPGAPHGRIVRPEKTLGEENEQLDEMRRRLAAEFEAVERFQGKKFLTDQAGLMRASTWANGAMDP